VDNASDANLVRAPKQISMWLAFTGNRSATSSAMKPMLTAASAAAVSVARRQRAGEFFGDRCNVQPRTSRPRDRANPLAMDSSAALCCAFGLKQGEAADQLERGCRRRVGPLARSGRQRRGRRGAVSAWVFNRSTCAKNQIPLLASPMSKRPPMRGCHRFFRRRDQHCQNAPSSNTRIREGNRAAVVEGDAITFERLDGGGVGQGPRSGP